MLSRDQNSSTLTPSQGEFLLDAQLVRGFDLFGALEADVFAMLFEEVEENQLSEAVTRRSVRHA